MRIGIIGAGFVGRALASLGVRNGDEVMVSNSRGPKTLLSTEASLGCQIGTVEAAVAFGDIVIVAIPFGHYSALAPELFAGKIVLDASNYYPERDGPLAPLDERRITTSELLAEHLDGARVVKAFNAIVERDMVKDARPRCSLNRRALPVAGDDKEAKKMACCLISQFGYDVVDAGPLAEGWRFERSMPAFCVPLDKYDLRAALDMAAPDLVPDGAWRPAGMRVAATA